MDLPSKPRPGRRRFTAALATALAAALLLPAAGRAAREDLTQSRVEAAYLFKFASFITWPDAAFDSPSSPIVVGVHGDDALVRELEAVAAGKRVQGRPLQVRQVVPGGAVAGLHMLFVGAQAAGGVGEVLEAVAGQPVLTVSDDPAVHARGTMVNFVVVDQRVRFDVALPPVRRSGLHVSALMLTAARDVARSGN